MNLDLLESVLRIRSALHSLHNNDEHSVAAMLKALDPNQARATLGLSLLILRKTCQRDADEAGADESALIDHLLDQTRDWLTQIGTEA